MSIGPFLNSDVIAGSGLIFDQNGAKHTRIFQIAELNSQFAESVYDDALAVPGIPLWGAPHPSIPDIYVSSLRVENLNNSPNQVTVIAEYDDSFVDLIGSLQVELIVTTQIKQTNLDKNGNVMNVTLTKTVEEEDGTIHPENVTQGGLVEKEVPLIMIRVTRPEEFRFEDQTIIAQNFVTKLNQQELFGLPAKSLLLKSRNATPELDNTIYRVVYEFQHDEDLWVAQIAFEDPETGQPAGDIVQGIPGDPSSQNGVAYFELYDVADFSPLQLDPLNIQV